jgi:hypothetical protein
MLNLLTSLKGAILKINTVFPSPSPYGEGRDGVNKKAYLLGKPVMFYMILHTNTGLPYGKK